MQTWSKQLADSLGNGPLTEPVIKEHVFPLFSQVRGADEVYLLNHSLGRPLDATAQDIEEYLSLWRARLNRAWEPWLEERDAYRTRLARLLDTPRIDCVVPKSSAGEGLRTVLNGLPQGSRVLVTTGEFDSSAVVLRHYEQLGRIALDWVQPNADDLFEPDQIISRLSDQILLVVVSHVMFRTGQIIHDLGCLAARCRAHGARLLVDAYHSLGALPVRISEIDCDFIIGGCYKYLRGGPGAAFLYVSPKLIDSGFMPPDIGWFALDPARQYRHGEQMHFASGGDALLEGTPPVAAYYQARAGLEFTLAVGIDRLREYSLCQLRKLKSMLAESGISSSGADPNHGAFLTIKDTNAARVVPQLRGSGIRVDCRGEYIRMTPDLLITEEQLRGIAAAIAKVIPPERRL